MQKYRKKPIIVEAVQWDGGNHTELDEFTGGKFEITITETGIQTSEGFMRASVGDYIIKEPFDKIRKFYPCKPDIFEATYDHI